MSHAPYSNDRIARDRAKAALVYRGVVNYWEWDPSGVHTIELDTLAYHDQADTDPNNQKETPTP